MAGLVELLFVFAIIIGWAVYELRSTRRPPRAKPSPPDDEAAA